MKYIFLLLLLAGTQTYADEGYFRDFILQLKEELPAHGVDPALIDTAFGGQFIPVKTVYKKMNNQPESKFSFDNYVSSLVSDKRVSVGVEKYNRYVTELANATAKHQVPSSVLVALWGIESFYGRYTGTYPIVPALATLAYDSHRKSFFKKELIAALQIAQAGHKNITNMTGSWAGAMGQNQFMPTSFLSYADDGDGDGKADIWGNEADIFASSANYLKRRGWQPGEKWGQRVVLNKILPPLKLNSRGLSDPQTIAEWQRIGVNAAKGELSSGESLARLFIPNGPSGKAYLVYSNFDVIMRWNNSSAFAFSVLTLADRIAAESA